MTTLETTPALDQLMALQDMYGAGPEHDEAFLAAMREAIAWHLENNAPYRELARRDGFNLENLQTLADLVKVPHVFINVFKQHELLSIPREGIALNLTSSGTTGQKSQVFFDQRSMQRGLEMVNRGYEAMGLVRRDLPTNYLIFAYDPEEARNVGTAFTDSNLTKLAPKKGSFHALRWDAELKTFTFREAETLSMLQAFAAEGLPVRFIGFPAFLHRLLSVMRDRKLPKLKLGPDSYVLTGGGWKTSESEKIEPARFIAEVEEFLGLPGANVRDGYGMVEHGVPYLQCEHHRFHVPTFSRAFIREVSTLEVLPPGEVGFLHLMTPFNLAMPTHSLLVSDLATMNLNCPCGRPTPTIEIQGRAGTRKNKGCAISASQMLK